MASRQLPNYYDVHRGIIFLRPDASPYAQYHERAHEEQHRTRATVFVVWSAVRRIRLIGWLATLWIEVDAYRRAKSAMQRLGLWTDEACQEAKNCLISYATKRNHQLNANIRP